MNKRKIVFFLLSKATKWRIKKKKKLDLSYTKTCHFWVHTRSWKPLCSVYMRVREPYMQHLLQNAKDRYIYIRLQHVPCRRAKLFQDAQRLPEHAGSGVWPASLPDLLSPAQPHEIYPAPKTSSCATSSGRDCTPRVASASAVRVLAVSFLFLFQECALKSRRTLVGEWGSCTDEVSAMRGGREISLSHYDLAKDTPLLHVLTELKERFGIIGGMKAEHLVFIQFSRQEKYHFLQLYEQVNL